MIVHIVGARPNFVKAAPVINALKGTVQQKVLHTGQHFSDNMSADFLKALDIGTPDIQLDPLVGGDRIGSLFNSIKIELRKLYASLVIVYGDVDSTLAGAMAAKSLNLKLCHVESGLRSFNYSMPEEGNRIVVDNLSDYLFCTEPSASANLMREGLYNNAYIVGNTMIESLDKFLPRGVNKTNSVLVTFHRPSNVDNKDNLKRIIKILNSIARNFRIEFPIHPRTRSKLLEFNLMKCLSKNIITSDPLSYIDFVRKMAASRCIITDSGGIQEEATYARIPCITYREDTERPITLVDNGGTNILTMNPHDIKDLVKNWPYETPEHCIWDTKASQRIANIIKDNILCLKKIG